MLLNREYENKVNNVRRIAIVIALLLLTGCASPDIDKAREKIKQDPVVSGIHDNVCDTFVGQAVRQVLIKQLRERISVWPEDGVLCDE